MAGASDYLENKLLDHITGKTSYTMPTAYVALLTATPNDASTGATITEANYTTYARVTTSGATWNAASGGSVTNAAAITFPVCSAGTSTVTHFAILDSGTIGAGNVLAWGTCSLAISAGITPQFAASALTLTLD